MFPVIESRSLLTSARLWGSLLLAGLTLSANAVVYQAENYNVAYDTTPGNSGGAYRNENVDIENTQDSSGGSYNVGWTAAGEWLVYNGLNIPTTGSYIIRMRVASPSGATASVDLNAGAIQLGELAIPATGGWQNWTTVSRTVNINAGTYNLGVFVKTAGWNFNWIEVVSNGAVVGGPNGFTKCANENQTCSFSGTRNVAYGANGKFNYKNATGSIACNNATFGDPISGTAKACYYSNEDSSSNDCGSTWYKANLTNYESYPDPGSPECIEFNGCTWAGQFYGLNGVQPLSWVKANNIAAVHLKDWGWQGLKTINLRQGTRKITAKVYDACSDSDCNGCCTQNATQNGLNYLVDLEKYTMQRFGSGSGIVEFQICN